LNILFLSTENPFPVDHGHHIRTYHVLKALAAHHHIYFVAFAQDPSGLKYTHELQGLCKSIKIFQLRFRGWRQAVLALVNLFSPLPLIAQKYHDPQTVDYIKKLIDEVKIDLVHIDLLHLANYRRALNSRPCILVNHNVESLRILRWSKIERNILLQYFLRYQYFKLRNFERAICTQFNRCIVVSDYDKAFLADLCGGGNFVSVPNGVDADYFQPSDGEVIPNSLVWTGSMKSPYNRDAVIYFLGKIWPIIQRNIPEARVTFVGGSPAKKLKDTAKKYPNINYTDYVQDVRRYVAESAVFIAPLRCGSGTKIKILNAMAQGKPVVTTSIGAEGIDAKPDAEIIIADAPAEFAEKTIYLLRNPQEARKIGLRARKVITEKYDWKIINKKIEQIYKEFEPDANRKPAQTFVPAEV